MDFTPESISSFLSTISSLPVKAILVADIDCLVFRDDYNPDEIMEHGEVEVRSFPLSHAAHARAVPQRHALPRHSQHASLQQLLQQVEVRQGRNAPLSLSPSCLRMSSRHRTFPPIMILARNSRCGEMEGV